MHNTKKALLLFLSFFALFNTVKAEIRNGDKITVENINGHWIVKDVTQDKSCDIDAKPEPEVQKAKSIYTETFGYTYENTCTEIETISERFCSEAKMNLTAKCDTLSEKIFDKKNKQYKEIEEALGGNQSYNNKQNNFVAVLNSINDKKNDYTFKLAKDYPVLKLDFIEEYVGPKNGDCVDVCTIRDTGGGGTGNVDCSNYFIDYIDGLTGEAYVRCKKTFQSPCTLKDCPDSSCIEDMCNRVSYYYNHEPFTVTDGDVFNDEKPTSITDYLNPSIIEEKPECHSGDTEVGRFYSVGSIGNVYKRICGTVSKTRCKKVEPTKVEAYTIKLTIYGNGLDKEAYCINPAFDYNSKYTWDTTFESSKCVDSLHSYNSKTGEVEFDMECGYVYIIAEAKRINAELGKEVFSYPVISTAMRLFGTGITDNDNTLPINTELTKHLETAGYYTTYSGWGYAEFTGIPGIRPKNDKWGKEKWPNIYKYFMPKFYSIYIHSAKVASSYLKNNIRYSDVGNIKCDSGEYCVMGADGKKYIVDSEYYLNHKECQKTFKNCKSTATDLNYNTEISKDRLDSYPPVEGNKLKDFLIKDTGQQSNCTDESGLGVLCGLKNEKISGGNIGDSDYLDAIYLYIRALQGNKITYERKVQEAIDKYVPIEGLTRVIYNSDGENEGYVIRYTIDTKVVNDSDEVFVDCDKKDKNCEALIFVYDAKNELIQTNDHYDYCKKNYCYVEVTRQKICKNQQTQNELKSVVVTDPNLKANIIKKIGNGGRKEQILYVYDDTASITGGFCQEIIAVQDDMTVQCPCDSKEKANTVIPNGNIKDENKCSPNYNAFDELYYGDPSMSTILNACFDEDKLKYDFTEDLNANGNDLVHEGEQPVSKYSYQIKSDNFNVCTLYCRDESRLYLANKTSVRAGMHLKYDIGGSLLNKKLINETVNQRDGKTYKYMPSVVLQYRECTSIFNYDKWKKLYDKADNPREKNQLIYSAYNCNLYTTDEIVAAINNNKIPDVLGLKNGKYVNKTGSEFTDKNSLNNNYAEPAMIEYSYDITTGKATVVNDWGTTKDYLLKQEACTSIGKENGSECARYDITDYSDSYLSELGILMNYEHGLVKSNLNNTIYCSGESCYKLKGKDGKYYYNPNESVGQYDYTAVDERKDGNKTIYESGKILSYNDWALQSNEYGKGSSNFKSVSVGGYTIPKNEYSSFIVVSETGFYNDKSYYANSYSGEISVDKTEKNTILDPNIYPLHLNKDTKEYPITSSFTNVRTAYKRSKYYTEKNYSLNENIQFKTNALPSTFKYICYYDVYNITKYDGSLGFTYRVVDLEDVFASVTEDASKGEKTREYPENWSTDFSQSSLSEIENSSSKILEPENDGDSDYSYLEYSYTLTKQGIKKIRKYNDTQKANGGYLNDTLVNCEYDSTEGIFYNCDSSFLDEISKTTSEYYGEGLITINKDNGASEFCSSMQNADKDYCKYQKKSILTAGGNN